MSGAGRDAAPPAAAGAAPLGVPLAGVQLAALEALGEATRRLVAAVVGTDVGDTEADAVAASVHALAARLERERHAGRRLGTEDFRVGRVPLNPVVGTVNPLAPPMRAQVEPDGSVTATVLLGREHEGPPGAVHGGVTALLLDHLLGHAVAAAGAAGMTAGLTLRYLRPTPYGVALQLSARRTGTQGRKVFAEGRISSDGRVTVEATGVFLSPRTPRA